VTELRKDPVTERWVIVGTSPAASAPFVSATTPPEHGPCPFCPGNEAKTPPEILAYRMEGSAPNGPGWWVRVFPNQFPILRVEETPSPRGIGVFDLMNGTGANEVFVETPEHGKTFAELSDSQIEKVLWAYRDRIQDLERDRRLRYIMVFKNHGWEAGALLTHPHSQLIALPIVPRAVMDELRGGKRYFQLKERCIFCDIIRQELEQDIRVVTQSAHFLVCTPFASRFPFEISLLPKRHDCTFIGLGKEEMMDLARILKAALTALSRALGDRPYNFLLHIAPNLTSTDEEAHYIEQSYHWHLEIMPRLLRIPALASGSGLYLNPTPPEEAAVRLRQVLP
jgi:UDPglucose--hexose-1-phosphate uridylyltransferase